MGAGIGMGEAQGRWRYSLALCLNALAAVQAAQPHPLQAAWCMQAHVQAGCGRRSSAPRGLGHAAAGHHPQLVPAVGVAVCRGAGGRAAADHHNGAQCCRGQGSCGHRAASSPCTESQLPHQPRKTMSHSPPFSGLARGQIRQTLHPSAPLGSQWKRTQPGHVMMRCTMDPKVNSVAAAKPASAPARRWGGGAGRGKIGQSCLVAKWAGWQARCGAQCS